MQPIVPTATQATSACAVIVNPTKVGDLEALKAQVSAAFQEVGWDTPAWYETTAEDAGLGQTEAAIKQGVGLVVACGGDGTVDGCVTALRGTDVALGIVPTGTGNLLARALKIPLDLVGALNVITGGHHRRIDVADADGNTFLVLAGMGLDAELVGDASEGLKARIGVAAYVWTALRRLLKKPMNVRVTLDQQKPLRRYARSVLAGKVGQLPGGIQFMDVEPDDGRLAVAIITANSIRHWINIAWAVLTRKTRVPRVEIYHAKVVHIEANRAQRRQVDGDEITPGKSMTMRVVPGAIVVCVPQT